MAITDFRGEYRWLSNFGESPIEVGGKSYATVEHFYQAMKATTVEEHEWVRTAPTPGQSKRRGQKVEMVEDWEEIKLGVMEEGLRRKFQIPELRKKLLRTGFQHLMEGNTWGDTFWGVHQGEGLNHLGRLLMDIREECREECRKEEENGVSVEDQESLSGH